MGESMGKDRDTEGKGTCCSGFKRQSENVIIHSRTVQRRMGECGKPENQNPETGPGNRPI